MAKTLLYFVRSCEEVAQKLVESAPELYQLGAIERKPFEDGELYDRFLLDEDDLQDRKVAIVANLADDTSALEAFHLGYWAQKYGALKIIFLIPQGAFPKEDHEGWPFNELVSLAYLFCQLPEAPAGTEFAALSNGIDGEFRISASSPAFDQRGRICKSRVLVDERLPASSLLLASRSYGYMAEKLVESASDILKRGSVIWGSETARTPESRFRIADQRDLPGRDVVVLAGLSDDQNALDAFHLGYQAQRLGAERLTFLIPWSYYSTMERDQKEGELAKFKSLAYLLSQIPEAPRGNRFVFLDLHTEGEPFYLEGPARTIHLYGKSKVFNAIKRFGDKYGLENIVLAATDEGRAKWVRSLATDKKLESYIGVGKLPYAYIVKQRDPDTQKTKAIGVWGKVRGKHVLQFDDMARTLGSGKKASSMFLAEGALSVTQKCTHGPLPDPALPDLVAESLVEGFEVTNSHPRSVELEQSGEFDGFLNVRPVEDLFVGFLRTGRRQ